MKSPSVVTILVAVVGTAAGMIAMLGLTAGASAAPQQLTCALTPASDQPASQNQSIVVVFDQEAGTLQAQAGTQSYKFDNVSISNVAISGSVDNVSLGIDRSSLGIVWQQYGADEVTTEFGQCRQVPATTTGQ